MPLFGVRSSSCYDVAAVFGEQVGFVQVAVQVAVGIKTEDALTHWGRSVVCGAQVVLAAAGCYAYVGETGGVGVVVAEQEGVAGTFGTGDVFAQQAFLHQVLYVTAGSVLGALCGDMGRITPQILRQKCKNNIGLANKKGNRRHRRKRRKA